jgi:hypothetical protein
MTETHRCNDIVVTSVRLPNSVGMVPVRPWLLYEILVVLVGNVVGSVAPLLPRPCILSINMAVAARGSIFFLAKV